MMDCLLAKCIPCVTDCVMAELEKLGTKYRLALRLAKDPRFERLPCTHEGTYADDCILQRCQQHRCYIVATCDKDLKRKIRKVLPIDLVHQLVLLTHFSFMALYPSLYTLTNDRRFHNFLLSIRSPLHYCILHYCILLLMLFSLPLFPQPFSLHCLFTGLYSFVRVRSLYPLYRYCTDTRSADHVHSKQEV